MDAFQVILAQFCSLLMFACCIELGLLSGIAAVLRFPINDPEDDDDDEVDSESGND